MKIKLVTFAPHPNFGTCLQSYALNYILNKMGHDVEFIYNRQENKPLSFKSNIKRTIKFFLPKNLVFRLKKRNKKTQFNQRTIHSAPYIIKLPNHFILKLFSKLPCYRFFAKKWYYDNIQKRKVYKFTFLDGNFKMKRLFVKSDYNSVVEDADLFITGSDQIWNPYCGGYNPMMFLEFAKDVKRVAYSSSISQPTIPIEVKDRMKKALSKFTHIAVREQKSVELLNQLLDRTDVKLVVDPTYLLSAEEWEKFGNRAVIEFPLPEKYIFCYFVGDKRKDVYEEMVQQVKLYTGINEVITLECYNRKYAYGNGRLYKDAGPYEWVYLLQHASYICMDSFHATVFALKFQKEFVHTMKNEENEIGSQNTRMHDILNRYNIAYKNYNNATDTKWQQIIDYKKVNPIINAEVEDSMNFLKYEIENN